ncbi:MAG: hypothetical protein IH840_12430 [Candidatus Heimdallarchaeota archaeon]|nr:hypothetical protein [Candidatus Heimdallarchaeota archaeon]
MITTSDARIKVIIDDDEKFIFGPHLLKTTFETLSISDNEKKVADYFILAAIPIGLGISVLTLKGAAQLVVALFVTYLLSLLLTFISLYLISADSSDTALYMHHSLINTADTWMMAWIFGLLLPLRWFFGVGSWLPKDILMSAKMHPDGDSTAIDVATSAFLGGFVIATEFSLISSFSRAEMGITAFVISFYVMLADSSCFCY